MATVVIYDSGVGGLSVYQEVAAACPQHDLVFFSDNQAFPYGTKAEADLIERVLRVSERINEHYAPDVLVIACNTASTLVLDLLRNRFDFEVVGVVPAVKPAANQTKSKHIGLLATPATVGRTYTDELINEFASDCTVTKIGSSELVQLAEDKLYGRTLDLSQIDRIISPLVDADELDVLVLACTHFPLINKELASVFTKNNRSVTMVDSGAAVAQRVHSVTRADAPSAKAEALRIASFSKALSEPELFKQLDRLGFTQIEVLDV